VERQPVETVGQRKGRPWKLWINGKADCGICGSVERQTAETVDQWKGRLWKMWIKLDRYESCSSTGPHFIHGPTAPNGPRLLYYQGFPQTHHIQ
jgi:hypothetical protein